VTRVLIFQNADAQLQHGYLLALAEGAAQAMSSGAATAWTAVAAAEQRVSAAVMVGPADVLSELVELLRYADLSRSLT
jgi:hypothetical protein